MTLYAIKNSHEFKAIIVFKIAENLRSRALKVVDYYIVLNYDEPFEKNNVYYTRSESR